MGQDFNSNNGYQGGDVLGSQYKYDYLDKGSKGQTIKPTVDWEKVREFVNQGPQLFSERKVGNNKIIKSSAKKTIPAEIYKMQDPSVLLISRKKFIKDLLFIRTSQDKGALDKFLYDRGVSHLLYLSALTENQWKGNNRNGLNVGLRDLLRQELNRYGLTPGCLGDFREELGFRTNTDKSFGFFVGTKYRAKKFLTKYDVLKSDGIKSLDNDGYTL